MNQISFFLIILYLLSSCSESRKSTDDFDISESKPPQTIVKVKASEMVDLTSKGVGDIKELIFNEDIDAESAIEGENIFTQKCSICHKLDEKFIGPPLGEVLKRRRPEWVMNMILNPDIMIKEDSLAKAVYMEFNGSPMTNQGLTQDEARNILEYFRTTSD